MVDVFIDIYDGLKNKLLDIDVPISTGYQIDDPKFPCVVIDELNNTLNLRTLDVNGEYASDVSLEINIYSNSKTPRNEIRPIIKVIDEYMSTTIGAKRDLSQPTPNADNKIYRHTMRYSFIVDKNLTIYRR